MQRETIPPSLLSMYSNSEMIKESEEPSLSPTPESDMTFQTISANEWGHISVFLMYSNLGN